MTEVWILEFSFRQGKSVQAVFPLFGDGATRTLAVDSGPGRCERGGGGEREEVTRPRINAAPNGAPRRISITYRSSTLAAS